MRHQGHGNDFHSLLLDDIDFRREYGSENAKLEIALALVHAREITNMTQSDLARLAGTSQAYIARLERGDANPTIGNIGGLMASIWMKPNIEPVLLDPAKSIETVVMDNLSPQEASVDFSELAPRGADYRVMATP